MFKRFAQSLFGRRPAKTTLDAGAEAVDTTLVNVKSAIEKPARRLRAAPVAPALLIATGAGVAFWYWTQWARGQAESEAAAKDKDEPTEG